MKEQITMAIDGACIEIPAQEAGAVCFAAVVISAS